MAKKKGLNRQPRARRIGSGPQFGNIRLTGTATARMAAALADQHHLEFTVKWTKSAPLVLMSLQVKAAPDNLWRELLDHPLGGNSGELVADMGVYGPGEIKIGFIVNALTDVKQAATFVVEDTTHVTDFKPAAGQPLKSLKQGDTWSENDKYHVGAAEEGAAR